MISSLSSLPAVERPVAHPMTSERHTSTASTSAQPASFPELARANPKAATAAREFEAVFLRQLLSSVQKVASVGSESKTRSEVVGSMMVGTLSEQMSAAGGIGLSEVILRALTLGHAPERPLDGLSAEKTSTDVLQPTSRSPGIPQ